MARPFHLPPSAATLSASLRDLGYSLETAVADLIDNSISAGATLVQLFCDLSREDPVLVVADNGHGMNEEEIISAMRHGARDPRQTRSSNDLGRFGLGLKTASFSQCRNLTVVSKTTDQVAGAEWDLDRVEADDDWYISILETSEVDRQPFFETLQENGTLVVWRNLDRLFEDETGQKKEEIVSEKLVAVERHLALVFHRFLTGEVKGHKRLTIQINGHAVIPFDPFCRKNPATQILPEEIVWLGNSAVRMQPYVLPHHSRLSATEYEFYQSRSDFISNQGTYIYRNGRLMAWGDWFRLAPKGEQTKLARVQIDFSNELDEAWTIDIKKSRARPPYLVRERLRQIIVKIVGRSINVHRGRGRRLFQENDAPMWERYADYDGIRYEINPSHPLVSAIAAKLEPTDANILRTLLRAVSASLPIEMLYSDYASSPREINQPKTEESECIAVLHELKQILFGSGRGDAEQFLQLVRSIRLFDAHEKAIQKFIVEVL